MATKTKTVADNLACIIIYLATDGIKWTTVERHQTTPTEARAVRGTYHGVNSKLMQSKFCEKCGKERV